MGLNFFEPKQSAIDDLDEKSRVRNSATFILWFINFVEEQDLNLFDVPDDLINDVTHLFLSQTCDKELSFIFLVHFVFAASA